MARRTGLLDSLYVHAADAMNSRTVTAANLKGRKAVLQKVRATQKRLMHLQPEAGFRESYRIEGATVITVDDYISGRVFDDAVCYAFYFFSASASFGFLDMPSTSWTTVPIAAIEAYVTVNASRCP